MGAKNLRVPDFKTLDEQDKAFEVEAEAIEKLLVAILPGGLYDRLLGHMLARQASHFLVSHVQDYPKNQEDQVKHAEISPQ